MNYLDYIKKLQNEQYPKDAAAYLKAVQDRLGELTETVKALSIRIKNEDNIEPIGERNCDFDRLKSICLAPLNGIVQGNLPKALGSLSAAPSVASLTYKLLGEIMMINGASLDDDIAAHECLRLLTSGLNGYENARAVFAYGGGGAVLYAVKTGLNRMRDKTAPKNMFIIASRAAHYAVENTCQVCGVAAENLVYVNIDKDQTVDIKDYALMLEEICRKGGKVAAVILSCGTTVNCAIDDISSVARINAEVCKNFNLERRPFIYADSVAAWQYLIFKDYDFENNPLGISRYAKNKIAEQLEKIKAVEYADAFAADFHKFGVAPYTSTLYIVKERETLKDFLCGEGVRDNIGALTLESSRNGAAAYAAYMSLMGLGKDGLRSLLTHQFDMKKVVLDEINEVKEMHGLEPLFADGFGTDVNLFCHSKDYISGSIFSSEERAAECNNLTYAFYKFCRTELDKMNVDLSYTANFCKGESGYKIGVIRIIPMNPNLTADDCRLVVRLLYKLKMQFDNGEGL